MGPQGGRDFESDQHVQRLTGDLRVDGIHAEQLGRLYCAFQSGFSDFVEHDALGGGNGEAEEAARVVRDAGAFAVVVRHEIRFFALPHECPYFFNLVCLSHNLIFSIQGKTHIKEICIVLQSILLPIS